MYPVMRERQVEILQLLADGLSHNQIAKRLFLSYHTVRSHTLLIRHYFGVHSNVDAVAKARIWDVI
jgi:DNA-binding CsgD family transcriptional regulator